MALYELRTYTLRVGAMADAVKLYQELGFPALRKGGHDKHLVGYFQADTGTTVLRVENGKIAEKVGLDDRATALRQLGLLKAA